MNEQGSGGKGMPLAKKKTIILRVVCVHVVGLQGVWDFGGDWDSIPEENRGWRHYLQLNSELRELESFVFW